MGTFFVRCFIRVNCANSINVSRTFRNRTQSGFAGAAIMFASTAIRNCQLATLDFQELCTKYPLFNIQSQSSCGYRIQTLVTVNLFCVQLFFLIGGSGLYKSKTFLLDCTCNTIRLGFFIFSWLRMYTMLNSINCCL